MERFFSVVIVGDAEYVKREWKTLYNLPKFSILNVITVYFRIMSENLHFYHN